MLSYFILIEIRSYSPVVDVKISVTIVDYANMVAMNDVNGSAN